MPGVSTTNLIQRIDAAVMRQFDVKVNLRPQIAEQLHHLLGAVVSTLKLAPPSTENCRSLADLGITQGDVAAGTRRVQHLPLVDSQAVVEAVHAKSSLSREWGLVWIGFV